MNEIFRARKALEACLMISALCAEVTRSGAGAEALRAVALVAILALIGLDVLTLP